MTLLAMPGIAQIVMALAVGRDCCFLLVKLLAEKQLAVLIKVDPPIPFDQLFELFVIGHPIKVIFWSIVCHWSIDRYW